MIDSGLTMLLFIGIAWFWWDSRGAAERAITAAKMRCDRVGVSFLNDTVGWKKIRLKRNKQGQMQFQRTYFFEFASNMAHRYQGEIVMLGWHVSTINLDVYQADYEDTHER